MAILDDFITFLRINRSSGKKTIDAYLKDVESFFSFLELNINDINVFDKINEENLKEWLIERRNKVSNRTISRQIVAIKMFFTFLNEVYGIRNDVILNANGLKFTSGLPKAIQSDEISDIIENLDKIVKYKSKWELLRDKLLCVLLFASGLRISEALALKHKDFHGQEFIIFGKGQKERVVPALDVVIQYYNDYKKVLVENGFSIYDNDFVFINSKEKPLSTREVERKFQFIKISKNLAHFSPHTMRHSFATSLLENGANIRQIQSLLGHENLSTTQKYTKITQKVIGEKLKKIKW